jgi:hypothetical protein
MDKNLLTAQSSNSFFLSTIVERTTSLFSDSLVICTVIASPANCVGMLSHEFICLQPPAHEHPTPTVRS